MIPKFLSFQVNQYWTLVLKYWNQMTPSQYVGLLVFIAFVGWIMMKNASKR